MTENDFNIELKKAGDIVKNIKINNMDKSAIRLKAKALKDLYPEEYWRGTVGDLWNIALEEFVVTRQLYREAVIYYGDKWNKRNISISRKIHSI